MQVDIDKANEVIGVWERFHGFVEKYGLRGIFTTLVVLAIFGMMVSLFVNPEGFLKRIEDIQQKTNAERIEQRLKADPEIRSELMTVKNETNADRAYILEAHNGTSNTAGLHFLYMDMTYEEYSSAYESRQRDYTNLRTSNYPWMGYLYDNTIWCGSIDELEDIDIEFYYRLKKDNVKYIGIIMLYGKYNPIGCLGVAYHEENVPSAEDVKRVLRRHALVIEQLLNTEND